MIGELTEKGRKILENADSDRDFNEFDSGRVQIFRDFTFAWINRVNSYGDLGDKFREKGGNV